MYSIEIDFDVYKKLFLLREAESVTYNDVLRRILDLPTTGNGLHPSPSGNEIPVNSGDAINKDGWTTKRVTFPVGTEFRADYLGKTVFGKVESGGLNVNGTKYTSPSAAANAVTNTSVNGWIFWECKKPQENEWKLIDSLRKKADVQ